MKHAERNLAANGFTFCGPKLESGLLRDHNRHKTH